MNESRFCIVSIFYGKSLKDNKLIIPNEGVVAQYFERQPKQDDDRDFSGNEMQYMVESHRESEHRQELGWGSRQFHLTGHAGPPKLRPERHRRAASDCCDA